MSIGLLSNAANADFSKNIDNLNSDYQALREESEKQNARWGMYGIVTGMCVFGGIPIIVLAS